MNQSNPSYLRSENVHIYNCTKLDSTFAQGLVFKIKIQPTHYLHTPKIQCNIRDNVLDSFNNHSIHTLPVLLPTHIHVFRSELSMAFHLGVITQTTTSDCDTDLGTPIPGTLLACGMRFFLKPNTRLYGGSFSSHALAICLSNQNILFVFVFAAILAASSATNLATTSSLHTNSFSFLHSWTLLA